MKSNFLVFCEKMAGFSKTNKIPYNLIVIFDKDHDMNKAFTLLEIFLEGISVA